MAEYEHQFKATDEAQKTFVVGEMMPKDIKREFLTEPRTFDEVMEKLEIIIIKMMADDGPVPMDLGNFGTHDANRVIRTLATTCHTTPYVRSLGMGTKLAEGTGKKGPNGLGVWHLGTGADEWTSGRTDDGGKKGGKKGSKPDRHVDRDKGSTGNKSKGKGKGKGKGKSGARSCYDCGEQGSELSIEVNQQHRRSRGPRLVVGK